MNTIILKEIVFNLNETNMKEKTNNLNIKYIGQIVNKNKNKIIN